MRNLLLASATIAIGSFALATASVAAPVIHDSVGSFTSITAEQGNRTNNAGNPTLAVSPGRSQLENMFDGDANTMFSLGLGGTGSGGSLAFVISPLTNAIRNGSVIELTTGGPVASGHVEFADLYLGVDGGGWLLVGRLGNDGTIDGTGAEADAILSVSNDANNTTYTLTVNSGNYNSLMLQDRSPVSGSNKDGFDIAEFRLTSDSVGVPEPASIALLGAGLLGLGFSRRARRQA